MTPKQKRFVEEYLIDLNATQAAIRSGYRKKRADAIGYENLRFKMQLGRRRLNAPLALKSPLTVL